jgi:hypothetical protein
MLNRDENCNYPDTKRFSSCPDENVTAKTMPLCAREESKFAVLVMKLIDWFGF